jgi:hypothetical protein
MAQRFWMLCPVVFVSVVCSARAESPLAPIETKAFTDEIESRLKQYGDGVEASILARRNRPALVRIHIAGNPPGR